MGCGGRPCVFETPGTSWLHNMAPSLLGHSWNSVIVDFTLFEVQYAHPCTRAS